MEIPDLPVLVGIDVFSASETVASMEMIPHHPDLFASRGVSTDEVGQ
jgi:hypothetical protein